MPMLEFRELVISIRSLGILLIRTGVLVCAILVTGAGVVYSSPASGDLEAEALSEERVANGYLLLRTAMSGAFTSLDGTVATYKVPLWLLHPEDPAQCNGVGVLEPLHTDVLLTYLGFSSYATQGLSELTFDIAEWFGQSIYVNPVHGGHAYAAVVWSPANLNPGVLQGIPVDSSYHIDKPFEARAVILRDTSRILRHPGKYLEAADEAVGGGIKKPKKPSKPCTADHVLGVGMSQTAAVLRSFYFNGLNANSHPDFPAGLVLDGSIQAGLSAPTCRNPQGGNYSCPSATPASQGPVVTLNTELDVATGGFQLRGDGGTYRNYEIAGDTHFPLFHVDCREYLKSFGVPDEDLAFWITRQNNSDSRPINRAMIANLTAQVRDGVPLPPSSLIEGQVGGPFGLFIPALGDDFNASGGIRPVGVRTSLPGGDVGAPLGVSRGVGCNNPSPLTDPHACPMFEQDPFGVLFLCGASYPFTELGDEFQGLGQMSPCSRYYATHQAYTDSVEAAADYAVAQRWMLSTDVPRVLADAEANATLNYPGCVPSP